MLKTRSSETYQQNIENLLLSTKYISLKIYCLNVASLYVCNNIITFSTPCLCIYSPFLSTCLSPHYLLLQLLPSQLLLFPGTTEFSVVPLVSVPPSILSLLSRRTSHLFSFTLSSVPFPGVGPCVLQVLSSSVGPPNCLHTEKGGARSLTQRFSLCPLRTGWLNTFSDKNDLGIADSASALTYPRAIFFTQILKN